MASDAAGQPDTGQSQSPRLVIERIYDAPPQAVFQAWTDPQALSRWFGPADCEAVTVAQLDVREGGTYSIAFRTRDGEQHRVSGVYQEVDAPRKLVFSWAWQSTPERVSRVTIQLRTVEGGTELAFRHDRFFNDEARVNHARGWTGTFAKLDAWLGEP